MKRKYTSEELDYLRKIVPGRSRTESFKLFNKKFEPVSEARFRNILNNHKIRCGLSGRFKKGSVPANKGTKGLIKANSGSFGKGRETHNKADIGKETVTQEGYVRVKVGYPNIGIQSEKRVGVIKCSEEFSAHFINTLNVKFQVFPRIRIGNHIPACRIWSVSGNGFKRINRIAFGF